MPDGEYAVLCGGSEVDDRVDPFRADAHRQGEFDVPAAEGVQDGVDALRRGRVDPVGHAVAVRQWQHSFFSQPLVVCLAGETNDLSVSLTASGAQAFPAQAPA